MCLLLRLHLLGAGMRPTPRPAWVPSRLWLYVPFCVQMTQVDSSKAIRSPDFVSVSLHDVYVHLNLNVQNRPSWSPRLGSPLSQFSLSLTNGTPFTQQSNFKSGRRYHCLLICMFMVSLPVHAQEPRCLFSSVC